MIILALGYRQVASFRKNGKYFAAFSFFLFWSFDIFAEHYFGGNPKLEKNYAIIWLGQSKISQLTNIWNVTYPISYCMCCVMDYIQSTIFLHRCVNLNLSNRYLLNILISVMAECFNKMCFKFLEYINVA